MGPSRTLLLGCLLLLPQLHGQEPPACAWGWEPLEGGCYSFFDRELSWRRAEAFCQRLGPGSHLASLHSARELRAVAALLARSAEASEEDEEEDGDHGVWIGLHRLTGGRRWQWSDSSALDYGSWQRPPSSRRRGCAALRDAAGFLTWSSHSCSDRKPFICKSSA